MNNIALIIASLKTGGGAENVVSQLSFALDRTKNYGVHILTFYDADEERPYSGKRESLHENLKEFKLIKLFRRAFKINKFCKENNIDTAISFMEEANFPLLLSMLFQNRSKIIISERNNPLKKILPYRIGIYLFYSFADKTVSCTKKIQSILERSFRVKNVYTIYNQYDIERSVRLQGQDLPSQYDHIFQPSNFVFINVARLVHAKNQQRIVRAMKRVTAVCPHAKLVILGDGLLSRELTSLVTNMELNNDVFLLGNQINVFPFLKTSQCFVFSSLWEGFPNAVTEALSVNLPVISTDCDSGPREILAPDLDINKSIEYPYFGRYGILVNVDTDANNRKDELPDTMIRIMQDDFLRKKYTNGAERLSVFEPSRIIGQWEKLIK